MDIYLEVNALAGSSIDRTCTQVVELADRICIPVHFRFNGVTCIAHPGDKAGELATAWERELKSDHQYKVARGK